MFWKHKVVFRSSTEAEFCSLSLAICEVSWVRKLLTELEIEVPHVLVVYYDNIIADYLAKKSYITFSCQTCGDLFPFC